jgi:dienelactone hydrolase
MTTRPPKTVVSPPGTRRHSLVYLLWIVAFVAGAASSGFVRRTVDATTLMVELGTRGAPEPGVGVVDLFVQNGALGFPARLYLPRIPVHRCAVIGHGVHFKGIDEPRLVNFAKRLSARGVLALTPELAELADYRVTRQGVDVLAASVQELSRRCGGARVGLIGFSFAGGLSLLAASDPAVSAHLAYVTSVGGYHDLARELAFLLTDHVTTLHGSVPRKAHEYGLVVLLYEHLDALVPEEDLAVMQRAVHAWLTEDRKSAWAFASLRTTEAAERLFVDIVTGRRDRLRERLARVLAGEGDAERALSPSGRLARIPVPVYLLHGAGDSVIPPEETSWADAELGAHDHIALVSPLIEHVEIGGQPTIFDQWALVRFMSRLL